MLKKKEGDEKVRNGSNGARLGGDGWNVSGGDQNMDWMGCMKMNGMRIWNGREYEWDMIIRLG